jgi:DMSO/TMAO reductase YedYZ molybdopterin-dependent catalytic subunit
VDDFPVLTAGPTPEIALQDWALTVGQESTERTFSWDQFTDLATERFTTDLHCVTRWSKLDTDWEGVALDTLKATGVGDAPFALISSYGEIGRAHV